jgi:hypothetical protein
MQSKVLNRIDMGTWTSLQKAAASQSPISLNPFQHFLQLCTFSSGL